MKRSYDVYQPSSLIRDFYDSNAAYYQADDVSWSPFTKIGALSRRPAKPLPMTAPRQRKNPIRTPVFPAGFNLDGIITKPVAKGRQLAGSIPARQAGLTAAAVVARDKVLDTTVQLGRRLTPSALAPKKYSVDRGVYVDWSNRMRALIITGVASAVVLLMILLETLRPSPAAPVHNPVAVNGSSPQTTQSVHIAPAVYSTASGTSASTGMGGGSLASGSSKPCPTSTMSSSAPAPLVGGMGAGPVTSALPTTSSTTTSPSSGSTTTTSSTPSSGSGGSLLSPVTVPSLNVQAGGTPLVSTSPLSVSL